MTAIVSTHGHGDHWFGTAMLLKRFPEAKAHATAGTIEVMRFHGNPEFRAATWDMGFPGQIPASPVVSTPAPGNVFELEGNEVRFVEVGHSDTDKSSVIHVPSIGLVVAGDVVYNGYHQYLAESGNGGLKAWRTALDTVATLKPTSLRHIEPQSRGFASEFPRQFHQPICTRPARQHPRLVSERQRVSADATVTREPRTSVRSAPSRAFEEPPCRSDLVPQSMCSCE